MSDKLKEVAEKLVTYCRTQEEARGLDELYDPGAVSVEAMAMPGMDREAKGVEAIRGKHDWWNGAFEVHGGDVAGPFLHGPDRFTVIFEIDATNRESGERTQMREVALYTLGAGDKIVREEFFY